jgi:hypothetical protein
MRFHVVGETRRIKRCPLDWFSEVKRQHISIVRGSEKRSKGMQLRLRSQVQGCRLYVDSWYPESGWSHAANDGHDPNAMCYNFWPRAPGTTCHTAAVALRVVADADPFHVALVIKYDKQVDDTRLLYLAHCSETPLERLCSSFNSHAPTPSSSPPLELDISRTCRLRAVSFRGKVKVTLIEQ